MFRVTTTFVSENKTYETKEEYIKEIEDHFRVNKRNLFFKFFRDTGLLLNESVTLIDNKTLLMTLDWINEEASTDYIDNVGNNDTMLIL